MSSRFLKHSLVIRASLDGMELRIILLLCYILAKQPVLLILPEHLSYCINIDILEIALYYQVYSVLSRKLFLISRHVSGET